MFELLTKPPLNSNKRYGTHLALHGKISLPCSPVLYTPCSALWEFTGLRIYFICKKTQNNIGLRVVWPVVSNPINTTFYRNKAEPSLYTTVSIFHPYFVHRFILFPKIPNLFLFPFTFPTLFFNHLFILLTLFYFC